ARFVSPPSIARFAGSAAPAASARDLVLSLLSPAPVAIDELIRAVGLPARDVQTALLDLDLEGRLERHGAALVSLLVEKPGA
ncbi:MAG: DNA-protecting protein DprA, partial [Methylocystis sp.]